MTILELIQRSTDFLAKKGVASPRLQVELLVAHALKMPRMNLYLNFERPLADAETNALRVMIQRRGQREPLQYITGSTSFCGLEIAVDKRVLIPRPETELLAERAWKFLQTRVQTAGASARTLDLCTGSGCLAIALAAHAQGAEIWATDVSQEALAAARQNAARLGFGERIRFQHSDGFAALQSQIEFDLIVSNPPYIPAARIESLDPEVRDHEPRHALDGGPDGMDFYRRIAVGAGKFLKPEGRVMVELDDDGAEPSRRIFEESGWTVEAIDCDYNQRPRILIARPRTTQHDTSAT